MKSEVGMRNAEGRIGKSECGMGKAECGMGKAQGVRLNNSAYFQAAVKFVFMDRHIQYFQASSSRISRTITKAASDLPYGTTQTLSSTSIVDPSE